MYYAELKLKINADPIIICLCEFNDERSITFYYVSHISPAPTTAFFGPATDNTPIPQRQAIKCSQIQIYHRKQSRIFFGIYFV